MMAKLLPTTLVASTFLLSACSKQSDSSSSAGNGASTVTVIPLGNEATEERRTKLKAHLIKHREALAKAYATPGDYVLVAILDRNVKFQPRGQTKRTMPETYTQLLILHRDVFSLDDHLFSVPGKEESGDAEIETVMGELISVDKEGNAQFAGLAPAKSDLVVEWFVQNQAPVVSLHFGGIPCLKVKIKD